MNDTEYDEVVDVTTCAGIDAAIRSLVGTKPKGDNLWTIEAITTWTHIAQRVVTNEGRTVLVRITQCDLFNDLAKLRRAKRKKA